MHSERRNDGGIFFRRLILSILSFALLPPASMFGQGTVTDIFISQIGPRRTLARNIPWNNGNGNAGNNYILTPTYPWEAITIYIFNNGPTGATTANGQILAYFTGDPSTRVFLSCAGSGPQACSWVPDGSPQTIGPINVNATETFTFLVQGAAVVNIAIQATGGANTNTASVFMVESQQTASVSGGGTLEVNGTAVTSPWNFNSTTPAIPTGSDFVGANWQKDGSGNITAFTSLPQVFSAGNTMLGTEDDFFETGNGILGAGGTVTKTLPTAHTNGSFYSVQCTYNNGNPHTLPLQCAVTSANTFDATGDANAAFYWIAVPQNPGS